MEGRDRETDEPWGLTTWERQCVEHLETQTALEGRVANEEKEQALHRLWNAFQNAAMACAQLYKERHFDDCNCSQTCGRLWTPFQDTANTVTLLYKDGIDTHRRSFDIGLQSGIQKRNKDIVSWAKKKRKMIRRDDLLSYLAGRSPARRSPEVKSTSTSTLGSNGLVLPGGMEFDVDAGVQCFRPQVDSFDVRAGMDTTPFFAAAGLTPIHNSRRRNYTDTNLAEPELREGRKRSTCPADIVMESPSHKRTRYL